MTLTEVVLIVGSLVLGYWLIVAAVEFPLKEPAVRYRTWEEEIEHITSDLRVYDQDAEDD